MNKPVSLAELDKLQSIHPFTSLRKHEENGPVVMTRGRGIHVYDDQGREYIEGMAGLWCASLGFPTSFARFLLQRAGTPRYRSY